MSAVPVKAGAVICTCGLEDELRIFTQQWIVIMIMKLSVIKIFILEEHQKLPGKTTRSCSQKYVGNSDKFSWLCPVCITSLTSLYVEWILCMKVILYIVPDVFHDSNDWFNDWLRVIWIYGPSPCDTVM